MVKVSVIVPAYNVSPYLKECMDSLIGQTLQEMEFICVNDGSTDNTLEILQEYQKKDGRVKIIDKENGGYGKAMNIGLDACTGEYVGILEPDDYVRTNMYQELYEKAVENDVDIIKADFYRFVHDENGKEIDYYHQLTNDPDGYNRVIDPYEEPIVFKYIMNTWSGIYKRSFLEKHHIRHNETPGASFQDNGFWFQTFCFAKRIYFVDKPYYMNRRDNPNSSVHNKAKVFCMNDEYAYIHDFLDAHPKFKERYVGVYSFKRYHNYVNSYKRVGEEFKDIYMERFQKEMQEANDLGELKEGCFTEREWKLIQILLENWKAYVWAEKLHCEMLELEAETRRLNEELDLLKHSTTFKVGHAIMAVPCSVKESIKKAKNKHE